MASPMPGIVTTWTMGRGGQLVEGGRQQLLEVLLGILAVSHLGHQIADQGLGHGAAKRRHRLPGGLVQRLGLVSGRGRGSSPGSRGGPGDALGGGILRRAAAAPNPRRYRRSGWRARGRPRQEVVQSIDGLGRLLDLGLQAGRRPRGAGSSVVMGAGVASGRSTTAKRAMAWLSVSSVVRLGKWAF